MTAKWTIMIYLAGDNDLSATGNSDLDEMRMVGSSDDLNFVVLYDSFGNAGVQRCRIEKDGRGEKIETLKELDTGNPSNLVEFAKWAKSQYPAEQYALILWSHGNGWQPADIDEIATAVSSPGYGLAERSTIGKRQAFFRSTLQKMLTMPLPEERAICFDDGSNHSLDTQELGQAIRQIKEYLDQPLDVLGMDACLMSNFEVAFEVRHYAKFMVASEAITFGSSWPYGIIFKQLSAKPKMAADALAELIVRAFAETAPHKFPIATLSAFDLSQADSLANKLDGLAEGLIKALPGIKGKLWKAQCNTASFAQETLLDVNRLCQELIKLKFSADIRIAAEAVTATLQPGAGRFILAAVLSGETVRGCGGVSIYLPTSVGVSPYYAELAFARSEQHRWWAMLKTYKTGRL